MSDESRRLTVAEALAILADGDTVHTFVNPAPSVMVGADWDRAEAVELIEATSDRVLTGPLATKMGHGLAARRGDEWVYFATDSKALEAFA